MVEALPRYGEGETPQPIEDQRDAIALDLVGLGMPKLV